MLFPRLSDRIDVARRRYWVILSIGYRLLIAEFGARSSIRRPIMVRGGRWISVGERTTIRDGARIEVFRRSGESAPRLRVGNDVSIEQNVHLVCSSRVTIEDNVVIAANCAIVDTVHPLPTEVDGNVGGLALGGSHDVVIGTGSMLGVGVVVLPGVRIGARCMVGANSVVTTDLPDGSVASGAPARVHRKGS